MRIVITLKIHVSRVKEEGLARNQNYDPNCTLLFSKAAGIARCARGRCAPGLVLLLTIKVRCQGGGKDT